MTRVSLGRLAVAMAGMVTLMTAPPVLAQTLTDGSASAMAQVTIPSRLPTDAYPATPWAPTRVWAPCASGEMTGYIRAGDAGRPEVWVSGWIQPCAQTVHATEFAIIHYFDPHAYAFVQKYDSLTAPTVFDEQARELRHIVGELRALCLAYGLDQRIACVAVERDGSADTPVLTPIPTDDPRVRRTAGLPGGDSPDPGCGTCA